MDYFVVFIMLWLIILKCNACTDPESLVRGGPTLQMFFFYFVFLVDEGREDPRTNISGLSSAPAKPH